MSVPTQQLEKPEVTDTQSQEQNIASFKQVLKNRHFLLLWMAQLISMTILNAANFGIIVLVNDITHSVVMVGLAIIAFTLPAVPFSAIAGSVVDKINKRQVLWISNLLRLVTMLLIFVSLLHDRTNLWPLMILTFLTSLIGQFFTPAEGAAIPLLVGESELMAALSLFNITLTLSQAIGFLLLGRVVATLFPPFTLHLGAQPVQIESIDMLFVVVAVLYVVCAFLILMIPKRAFYEEHLEHTQHRSYREMRDILRDLWCDVVDGWQIVRADRLLFFSVVQLSVVGIVMQLIGELAGTFVQQVLHRPTADMSLILAPAAVGLVGSSLLMPRITKHVGKVRLTIIGFIVLATGFVLVPISQWLVLKLDPQHGAQSALLFWITITLVFILGVAMASVNIPTQTMMQEHAPESGRARVLALQFMLYNVGTIPILLFAGVVAQYLGFNQVVFIVSACLLLFCWWGAQYVKGRERHEYEGDGTLMPPR